jgi:hypothetical protein
MNHDKKCPVIIRAYPECSSEDFSSFVEDLKTRGVEIETRIESTRCLMCNYEKSKIFSLREKKDIYYMSEVIAEESKEEKRKRMNRER